MNDKPLFSFLNNLDWSAALQWYETHVNIAYLLGIWQQGSGFTRDDWLGAALLGGNTLVLIALIATLIEVHRSVGVRNWIAHKRSQLIQRTPRKVRTVVEAKIVKGSDLQKAYNLHRLAMYEPALEKYRKIIKSTPYDLNTWLVGIRIVSEMDEPHQPFVQFLKQAMAQVREKRPDLWQEIARYGRDKAPGLDQWSAA
jgi:hypothetical protein